MRYNEIMTLYHELQELQRDVNRLVAGVAKAAQIADPSVPEFLYEGDNLVEAVTLLEKEFGASTPTETTDFVMKYCPTIRAKREAAAVGATRSAAASIRDSIHGHIKRGQLRRLTLVDDTFLVGANPEN